MLTIGCVILLWHSLGLPYVFCFCYSSDVMLIYSLTETGEKRGSCTGFQVAFVEKVGKSRNDFKKKVGKSRNLMMKNRNKVGVIRTKFRLKVA